MDKIKVNNQIIAMRKYVKQAKVRTINKLVRESKLLRNKKGSDMQIEKYKRRAERFQAQIEIIKKINVDNISKMALLKQKDWQEILSCKTSSIEDRAFALIASHKELQEEVESFYLNNPKLEKLLPVFIKHWEQKKASGIKSEKKLTASELRKKKKEKIARRKSNNIEGKPILKNQKSQARRIEENVHASDHISHTGPIHSMLDGEIASYKNNNNDQISEKDNGSTFTHSHSKDYSAQDKKQKSVTHKNTKFKPKRKEMAIMKLDNLEDLENVITENMPGSGGNSEDDHNDVGMSSHDKDAEIDSFFTSADQPVSDSDSENLSSKSNNFASDEKRTKYAVGNKGSRSTDFRNVRENQKYRKAFPAKFDRHGGKDRRFNTGNNKIGPKQTFTSNSKKGNQKFKFSHQNRSHSSFSENTDANLHPSWQAKRKMKLEKSQLLPFKGHKIKFED